MRAFLVPHIVGLALSLAIAQQGHAIPIAMEFGFPGGFPVSLNGAPNGPSGPLTFTVVADNTTPDLNGSLDRGRFAVTSVALTAPDLGFDDEPVVLPALFVDTFCCGLTIDDASIDVDIGWNDGPNPSTFMGDINDLSTLPLPTFIDPTNSTFYLDTITLASGDTLGATVGLGGPDGTFFAYAVPEPSAFVIAAFGLMATGCRRYRRKKAPRVSGL